MSPFMTVLCLWRVMAMNFQGKHIFVIWHRRDITCRRFYGGRFQSEERENVDLLLPILFTGYSILQKCHYLKHRKN
jgi:hypothetical protein